MWSQSDERKCVVLVVDTEPMESACVVPTMKWRSCDGVWLALLVSFVQSSSQNARQHVISMATTISRSDTCSHMV